MAMADSKSTLIINPEKSCRLCLSQSLDMQNIASSLIVDGDIVSVVDMLVSLGITVCALFFLLLSLPPVDSLLTL